MTAVLEADPDLVTEEEEFEHVELAKNHTKIHDQNIPLSLMAATNLLLKRQIEKV